MPKPRKDSIIQPLLEKNVSHERLFMRFFALLIDLDRAFLRLVLQRFFQDIQPELLARADELEIWFDKQLTTKHKWPQPDIIITNPGYWVGEKEICYLIEIKRGAALPEHQVERYLSALADQRAATPGFQGDLCILVDTEQNKAGTPHDVVYTYEDLTDSLTKRRQALLKRIDKGQLNTPAGYLIEEFLLLIETAASVAPAVGDEEPPEPVQQ